MPKGVKATGILSDSVLTLMMEGPEITQIVAFDSASGEWLPQNLREPAKGRVIPIVAQDMAAYAVGRFVYAFSAPAKRWDVLELVEGAKPSPIGFFYAHQGRGREPPAYFQRPDRPVVPPRHGGRQSVILTRRRRAATRPVTPRPRASMALSCSRGLTPSCRRPTRRRRSPRPRLRRCFP